MSNSLNTGEQGSSTLEREKSSSDQLESLSTRISSLDGQRDTVGESALNIVNTAKVDADFLNTGEEDGEDGNHQQSGKPANILAGRPNFGANRNPKTKTFPEEIKKQVDTLVAQLTIGNTGAKGRRRIGKEDAILLTQIARYALEHDVALDVAIPNIEITHQIIKTATARYEVNLLTETQSNVLKILKAEFEALAENPPSSFNPQTRNHLMVLKRLLRMNRETSAITELPIRIGRHPTIFNGWEKIYGKGLGIEQIAPDLFEDREEELVKTEPVPSKRKIDTNPVVASQVPVSANEIANTAVNVEPVSTERIIPSPAENIQSISGDQLKLLMAVVNQNSQAVTEMSKLSPADPRIGVYKSIVEQGGGILATMGINQGNAMQHPEIVSAKHDVQNVIDGTRDVLQQIQKPGITYRTPGGGVVTVSGDQRGIIVVLEGDNSLVTP